MIGNLKEVKVKDTKTTSLMSLLLTFDIIYTFFSVSVVEFEQINVCQDNPWAEFW